MDDTIQQCHDEDENRLRIDNPVVDHRGSVQFCEIYELVGTRLGARSKRTHLEAYELRTAA